MSSQMAIIITEKIKHRKGLGNMRRRSYVIFSYDVFSSETMEARRQWSSILKMLKTIKL